MAHKFSDEAKEFEGGGDGNWLGFGVHEITIGAVSEGTTDSGTDFIEITVLGDNEEEDTARVWLTEKSEKYSFNTLRQIYVHCAPADKKDAARTSFDAAVDSTAVVDLLQNCIGAKCWFTKYPDPVRTYEASDGTIKKSINKNVYGYQPKLREDLMPTDSQKDDLNAMDKADEVAKKTGGTKADKATTDNIPENW